ncbi:Dot/Icm type IV secretion system effector LpnE [Xenorhabdus szentirmaii]|nr:Dot/Icm type IV secretion system effector LpnE [Xenorhabdus szentirmaii]
MVIKSAKKQLVKMLFLFVPLILSGRSMAEIPVPAKVYHHDPDFLSSFSIDMPNNKEEFYVLVKQSDEENSEANWMVAVIYDQSDAGEEAKKYYQRSIERQDDYMGRSAVNLGYLYSKNGYIQKAMTLFHQAGDAGYYGGFEALGTEYFVGDNITYDFEKARFYYDKAAELGCVKCQYLIDNWTDAVKLKQRDLKIKVNQ